jgi:hypothetical protein
VTNQTDFRDGFFLPEESLKPLFGEQAFGAWTLEVWDNRLGPLPAASSNALVSWKLEMAFAVTNPPLITLTNGIPYTNLLVGSDVRYFAVNSACNAGFITNRLTNITMNGGIDLIFNQFVLPTNGPGDVPLLLNVLTEASTNLIMGAPPLIFPARYFLKVQNTDPTTTNLFSLDTGIFCDTNPIVALTNNGACFTATVGGNGFQDYSFITSSSATQAIVEVVAPGGNVDLYLRRGVTPPLSCALADKCSANLGTSNEVIVLDTVTSPPLSGGGWTWTVRVFNNESTNVGYCIRVTTIEAAQVTVLLVTNTPVFYNTNSTGYADYYLVTIPPCPLAAQFQINEGTLGEVSMYLRTNHFPTPSDYFYTASDDGMNPFILLDLFDTSNPYPLTEGNWFITVLHTSATTPAGYQIAVSFNPDPSCTPDAPKLSVSAASYSPTAFDLNWTAPPSQTYQVQYTDVLPANWQNVGGPVTSTDGQFHFRDDRPQTGVQRFYRLVLVQ